MEVTVATQFEVSILFVACLKSVYSLIWGAHEIWGQGEGEPLALL